MKRKGMIFAAGLGTRFKPWTDHHPKALAIVNGKSLLQRNIEYFLKYDINEIVINVHHFADQIIHAIEENNGWGATITISDERDELLETGGGLKKASSLLNSEDIFIINADILTDLDLNELYKQHQSTNALSTLAVSTRNSGRYFLFDEQLQLVGWENIKTGEQKWSRESLTYQQKAFSGLHLIKKDLLQKIHQSGKFSMVDVYLSLASTEIIKGFDHTGSKFIDVGKPESVEMANKMFS
ncbi:nucleotidyltransferase family protein [Gynurincola endophyticus]|jgi:MurNAc alpha-1-phosphate uridylyltransferase|uniref:nucleotidyltransferase family protein n=1 Tax=Gynurincola endophyticus TaxID=2479004 RepID=UPI000F8F0D86|nr:nucleotidyltransferase family protein [Gynurincola endophyticus]